MAYTYLKLKARIVEIYGNQSRFAQAMNISETTVSNKMSGRTEFSKNDMVTWGKALKIKVNEYPDYFFT